MLLSSRAEALAISTPAPSAHMLWGLGATAASEPWRPEPHLHVAEKEARVWAGEPCSPRKIQPRMEDPGSGLPWPQTVVGGLWAALRVPLAPSQPRTLPGLSQEGQASGAGTRSREEARTEMSQHFARHELPSKLCLSSTGSRAAGQVHGAAPPATVSAQE